MNVTEIVSELASLGATLTFHSGRLMVTPKGCLTPELRESIRANRCDLEQYMRSRLPLVSAVLQEFGGELISSTGTETLRGEAVEDHAPTLMVRSCWPSRRACSEFTTAQLLGFSAGQLTTDRGCGDCELFRARLRSERMREKREQVERREKARSRANHEAFVNAPSDEDAD